MGKRILQLYVDDETIEIAKEKRINMSSLFRGMLEVEFGLTKGNEIEKLKVMNVKLTSALEQANTKITKLEANNDRTRNQPRRGRIIPI